MSLFDVRRWPKAETIKAWVRNLLLIAGFSIFFWYGSQFRYLELPAGHFEMSPKYEPGSKIFLYKHHGWSWKYSPKDILWLSLPGQKEKRLMRILAQKEGDQVILDQGVLTLNGVEVDGLLANFPRDLKRSYPKLKEGEIFLIFNNQLQSKGEDSLTEGPYAQKELQVYGEVFASYTKEEKD